MSDSWYFSVIFSSFYFADVWHTFASVKKLALKLGFLSSSQYVKEKNFRSMINQILRKVSVYFHVGWNQYLRSSRWEAIINFVEGLSEADSSVFSYQFCASCWRVMFGLRVLVRCHLRGYVPFVLFWRLLRSLLFTIFLSSQNQCLNHLYPFLLNAPWVQKLSSSVISESSFAFRFIPRFAAVDCREFIDWIMASV